jgi:hypothetical protein
MNWRSTRNASVPGSSPDSPRIPEPQTHQTLSPGERTTFGTRFGFDFSRVNIHDEATAERIASAHHAQAVTQGQDIMFARGRYAPGTPTGDALLAHELAHVVQQSQNGGPADRDEAEARADAAASQVVQGRSVSPHALGGAPSGLQTKPDDAPVLPAAGPSASLASAEIESSEAIDKTNPKIVQIAQAYKASAGTRVAVSADLSADAKNSSERERTERGQLGSRMIQVRAALESLGVPADAIDITPATAYATSAHGQVSAAVRQRAAPPPPFAPPMPAPPGLTPNVPPALATTVPSLNLEFTYGPVTISLPKEVRAKLPITLRGAKKLVIDLSAQVPGKFAFKITLDGLPYLRIALKAGAELDTKNTSVTGSAGLVIETTASICDTPDLGETREKIKTAGEKLNKAAQEYQAAADDDKLSKAIDIASVLGEIYDAIDKAKVKCKEQPRATFEFGYKRLLTPGSETDPSKLPPLDYAGVTGTFHF